jgi:hypothetical protein
MCCANALNLLTFFLMAGKRIAPPTMDQAFGLNLPIKCRTEVPQLQLRKFAEVPFLQALPRHFCSEPSLFCHFLALPVDGISPQISLCR